ncbi:hypothetical protein [Ruegeria arenilitoris]|uniref:hypothetical protein n=1 Tax=Ruegeria arenilitoris TaxID=1173585 RepID=UPI0020C5852A|nr:hypothetical protein [Ruegeria arenilitoris]
MLFRCLAFVALFTAAFTFSAVAQPKEKSQSGLLVELNAVQDVTDACRLTFLIMNETESVIEKAVFETVIFDTNGQVVSLSLFDFRELPADRPRVRQFDLPTRACSSVGQVLINGANTCVVGGSESDICRNALKLNSRVKMELLG